MSHSEEEMPYFEEEIDGMSKREEDEEDEDDEEEDWDEDED